MKIHKMISINILNPLFIFLFAMNNPNNKVKITYINNKIEIYLNGNTFKYITIPSVIKDINK